MAHRGLHSLRRVTDSVVLVLGDDPGLALHSGHVFGVRSAQVAATDAQLQAQRPTKLYSHLKIEIKKARHTNSGIWDW